MLSMNNPNDISKMREYYRTSDMLNLILYFPEVSPIIDLTIVEDIKDYMNNKEYLDTLELNRIDSLKSRGLITGIENSGFNDENKIISLLNRIKEKDQLGVLVLFNTNIKSSNRYERYAGISVGVDLGKSVYIDAVGKGFDGREVSKSICTHERYYIPWYKLRECTIGNFNTFRTYLTNQADYEKTRNERISFLTSVGIDYDEVDSKIPKEYQPIPDFIWLDVIKNILKKLEKNEEILENSGFDSFAISGHTEGRKFTPWQMFDKSRYIKTLKK